MADGVRRREPAVEVDALDQGVDAQHFEPVARRLHHRPIVSDADEKPVGRRREMSLNSGDQLALREIADCTRG